MLAGGDCATRADDGKILTERNWAMRKVWKVSAALLVAVGWIGMESARADRPSKDGGASLRLANVAPARGLERVTVGGRTLYVASKASLSGSEVVSTESIDSRDGSDVLLTLTQAGSDRLAELIETYGGDHVVFFNGRKAIVAGALSVDEGVATITGLSAAAAEQVIRVISGRTAIKGGPTMTVVAESASIAPGGAVTVDVFVSGVASLRTYQVTLGIKGGDGGRLVIEDMWIDHERPNYLFGSLQILDAVDHTGDRWGGISLNADVEAMNRTYVGSANVRASADASGAFRINVIIENHRSMLMAADNIQMDFSAGADAVINVGETTRIHRIRK